MKAPWAELMSFRDPPPIYLAPEEARALKISFTAAQQQTFASFHSLPWTGALFFPHLGQLEDAVVTLFVFSDRSHGLVVETKRKQIATVCLAGSFPEFKPVPLAAK
jgi:hypothetical protein